MAVWEWEALQREEYQGIPLFACHWTRDNHILLGGGGGQPGTGIVGTYHGDDKVDLHSFLNSKDHMVYSITANPSDPTELACSLDDKVSILQWEGDRLMERQTFTTDYGGDNAFQLAVAYHPDGVLLATGGEEKLLRIWKHASTPDRSEVEKLPGHKRAIQSLSYNVDGSYIASTSSEEYCFVWSTGPKRTLWQIKHVDLSDPTKFLTFRGCAFDRQSADVLFTWMNQSKKGPSFLARWNIKTEEVLGRVRISREPVINGALSSSGKYIVVATNAAEIVIYDATSLQCTARYTKVHNMPITGLCFSPDESRILSVSADRSYEIHAVHRRRHLWILVVLLFAGVLYLLY